jgi:hypothetical protein
MLTERACADACVAGEIDLAAHAVVFYSAEDPQHPIEHLLDGRCGAGASHWSSGRANTAEEILIEFDRPQSLSRLIFEAEELHAQRTQQVSVEFSSDGGTTFRRWLVQEYTFSPGGSTYQREDLRLDEPGVTHVRLCVVPNKSGSGYASLTSLRLFG